MARFVSSLPLQAGVVEAPAQTNAGDESAMDLEGEAEAPEQPEAGGESAMVLDGEEPDNHLKRPRGLGGDHDPHPTKKSATETGS
jgi:hypothetical protein